MTNDSSNSVQRRSNQIQNNAPTLRENYFASALAQIRAGNINSPAKMYRVFAYQLLRACLECDLCEDGVTRDLDRADDLIYNANEVNDTLASLVQQMTANVRNELCAKAPTIQNSIADFGGETVNRMLFLILKSFMDSLNIKRKMTAYQIVDIVSSLRLDFADLSITDILVTIREMKSGAHGSLYESFDYVKLGEALRAHREKKVDLIEANYRKEKGSYKNDKGLLGAIFETAKETDADGNPTEAAQAAAKAAEGLKAILSGSNGEKTSVTVRPMSESEYVENMKLQFMPHLDRLSAEDYALYISHFEAKRQLEIADWLIAQRDFRALTQSPVYKVATPVPVFEPVEVNPELQKKEFGKF